MATTTGTPKDLALAICFFRLTHPARRISTFSCLYTASSGAPGAIRGPPPWTLSARTVATTTTTSGARPDVRHLMLKKRSPPMVKSKPASVTTKPADSPWSSSGSVPASFRASLSAMMELWPMLMLANGPAWTNTGVPSRVCIRLGLMASFISAVSAPPAPRSSQVTGFPLRDVATTIRPRRSLMSARLVLRARIAMHSLATEMSKPVSRLWPFSVGAVPTVTPRRWRSLTSRTRLHVMVSGSMSNLANRWTSSSVSSSGVVLSIPSFFRRRNMTGANSRTPLLTGIKRLYRGPSFCVFSWNMRVSKAAARRLLAAVMA
ncbi:hypothetical protein G6O67_004679 [Ophiocordyceps sinensis]|uniref:Uncharacterized protein n=1 Tax=Ophiocordyceps sinensis TaxID=72228 RepID=A0A8H4PPX1_9HYPO|nr:hypothetical protein G6O67_004679 [Ophiocordyceps sinensis]